MTQYFRDAGRALLTNGYDTWVTVGMAFHHEFDGSAGALAAWNEWSSIRVGLGVVWHQWVKIVCRPLDQFARRQVAG